MTSPYAVVPCLLALAIARPAAVQAAKQGPSKAPLRELSLEKLRDKIRGGWIGQIVGVAYGGPTEFRFKKRLIEGPINWAPEMVSSAIDQDDLYVEMTFAEVLDRKGIAATTSDFAETFVNSKYDLWHANAGARRLLMNGVKAPWSGHPKYNAHANDIDFQIESDFIGLMTPGLPAEANKIAEQVGRVMNWGDGLYGGMFFSGMYAAAFFETDTRRVVELGLQSIPARSGYAQIVSDVLKWHQEFPDDYKATWRLIDEKWDKDDLCPEGAEDDFNIDARLNGAYVVLGLLYGNGSVAKTLEVATRAGQDSDCNPSSAVGILGTMLGAAAIEEKWTAGIPAMQDKKFSFTNYTLNEIIASTEKRALAVIERAGGKVNNTHVFIPTQRAKPPQLEQWDTAVPIAVVNAIAPDWNLKGFSSPGPKHTMMVATEPGASASVEFSGTGVALHGKMTSRNGKFDVIVDGKRRLVVNGWVDAHTFDESIFHLMGLAPGRHRLELVVRTDKDSRSTGHELSLRRLIVYGSKNKT